MRLVLLMAHQLIVLQELHNSLYFCQTENTNLFDLAEPIPGPSTGFYSELAAANKVVLLLVTSFLKNAHRASIIIQLSFLTVTEVLQENTVKCTFLMILPTTRSSISPRRYSGLNRSRLP